MKEDHQETSGRKKCWEKVGRGDWGKALEGKVRGLDPLPFLRKHERERR